MKCIHSEMLTHQCSYCISIEHNALYLVEGSQYEQFKSWNCNHSICTHTILSHFNFGILPPIYLKYFINTVLVWIWFALLHISIHLISSGAKHTKLYKCLQGCRSLLFSVVGRLRINQCINQCRAALKLGFFSYFWMELFRSYRDII